VATLAILSGAMGAVAVVVLVVLGAIASADEAIDPGVRASLAGDLAAVDASLRPVPVTDVQTLVVDVAGGVMQPGLRTLQVGDRVGDAIAAAGGFAPRADLAATSRNVNLAEPLVDGMKVLVPELGTDVDRGGPTGAEADALIDLNSASQDELESLPGVGPVTAERIVQAREELPFGTVEDLRDRGVVGQSVFDDIRDLVRAGAG
jgi:competence protein ComEA